MIDIRLREVTRVNTEDFDAKIVGYLAGEPVLGWEPYEEVSDRIHTVVDEFGSDALYVGHGTALTLYLKDRSPSLDAYAFWTQLRNPDAWQLRGTGLTRL